MYLEALGLALFTIFSIVMVALIGLAFWFVFQSMCEMWGEDDAE